MFVDFPVFLLLLMFYSTVIRITMISMSLVLLRLILWSNMIYSWDCSMCTWKMYVLLLQGGIFCSGWFLLSLLKSISQSVSSVAQSCPTLRPHELQHTRPPCPSPSPGVHSDSRPSSQWCHPAISSSVIPFSSCPQSLPASESQWVNSSHEVAKVLEFQL